MNPKNILIAFVLFGIFVFAFGGMFTATNNIYSDSFDGEVMVTGGIRDINKTFYKSSNAIQVATEIQGNITNVDSWSKSSDWDKTVNLFFGGFQAFTGFFGSVMDTTVLVGSVFNMEEIAIFGLQPFGIMIGVIVGIIVLFSVLNVVFKGRFT